MTQEQTVTPKKRAFNFENFMIEVGIFLLEIILPALVTGGLLFWVATTINFWKMDRDMAISIFAILFVLLSLVISVFLTDLVNKFRHKKSYRLRLIAMILGGLVIPIGVFSGVNFLNIRPGESYMARLISISLNQSVDVSMVQLGTTVIDSTSPFTKIQGINAINTIHSTAGMEQLFSILTGDTKGLRDSQVSNALSQAIASYGLDAKPGLIAAFQDHIKSAQLANIPSDLYNRYFAQSISGLQAEINAQTMDSKTKQAQLQQISGLAIDLQAALDNVESESLQASNADPTLDFVLNTFLQMNISQDGDIYALARTSASDANLSDSIRGKALLIMAKLGSKEDMPLLYTYLQNNSEIIKAYAFQAIANLNLKNNGSTTSK